MAFTGDNKRNSSGSYRPGSSRPARLSRGYSPGGDGALDDHLDATAVPPRRQRTLSQASHISTSQLASPASSRFAFLASPMSAFKSFASSPSSAPSDVDFQNDELMYLDIEAALFPYGQPSERDAFSPAAFKNLQMNATGLLQKYQAAYQSRTIHIRELRADEMTQMDEKGELEMKVHHLKLQLEEMSRKAAEQESIMQSLMEELNREKKLRVDEQFAREKKLMSSECSTVSEDLGAEEDQRTKWRKSGETSKSDLGSDTDGESVDSLSVFSRSRSPTAAASMSESVLTEVPYSQAKPANLPIRAPRPSQPPMTTLQKLFKGVSGESRDDTSRGVSGCRNCQGQEASMAWDTVSLLRDENKSLKERVTDLETAVEGALDALAGFGIET
ncbi:hypothetical protein B0I35DRAFT_405638 [Stachybotrys elegans]|uniref:Uncharacterized protein n=1 Tax=Stachybotrys elegans TaxID=80388 RepID=A0A8K0WVN7_9HYPO|nr:hypothetical protein B0I35DRAFT_405638 [Stachybotrys elegans]